MIIWVCLRWIEWDERNSALIAKGSFSLLRPRASSKRKKQTVADILSAMHWSKEVCSSERCKENTAQKTYSCCSCCSCYFLEILVIWWYLIPEDIQGHTCGRFLIVYKAIQSGTFHPREPPKMAAVTLLSEVPWSLALVVKSKVYVCVCCYCRLQLFHSFHFWPTGGTNQWTFEKNKKNSFCILI